MSTNGKKKRVVLLVGAPGSGKTTIVADMYPAAAVIHSDDYRSQLAPIRRALAQAFAEAHPTIVLDGCHATANKRAIFVRAAREAGYTVEALHIATPIDRCLAQSLRRAQGGGRKLPPVAIYSFRKHFTPPEISEGFSHVHTIIPEDKTPLEDEFDLDLTKAVHPVEAVEAVKAL